MENINEEYLVIDGNTKLKGDVVISGAKNSALKQIAAALILPQGKVKLNNVPQLADISNIYEILRVLGADVEDNVDHCIIDSTHLSSNFVPYTLATKLRASIVCLGALLARFKEAKVSLPGGCSIGARKLDLHIKGLKALGAKITEEQGYILAKADKLVGTKIYLDLPSNGATENIMLAATMAEGETIIENAARDPEIIDLANFLNKMGCDIRGAGSNNIHIYGKKPEELHGFEHTTIPDRIEAATFLIAGAMTAGKVTTKEVIEEDLQSVLSKFEDVGSKVTIKETGKILDGNPLVDITVESKFNTKLKGTDLTTMWYPGFCTDIQPIFAALLATCEGTSIVTENIYDSRFQYAEELSRMGAEMDVNGKTLVIKGVQKLQASNLAGKDLRSSAALAVAAMAAKGKSEVRGLKHLDRGYENFEEKFTNLGAKIKRIKPMQDALQTQSDKASV